MGSVSRCAIYNIHLNNFQCSAVVTVTSRLRAGVQKSRRFGESSVTAWELGEQYQSGESVSSVS